MMATAGTLANGGGAGAGMPRVLLLGDSISLGYTPPVRRALAGAAEVVHPPDNCQHTAFGLEHLEAWLGAGRWDVIHFNFGIHDTHLLDARGALVTDAPAVPPTAVRIRHTPEQYRANLERIVDRLERTGAALVWASSTPVLHRAGERLDVIPAYNRVAADLMAARGIAVNDLFGFVMPHVKEWQRPDRCHFTVPGYEQLGRQVADAIRRALEERQP